MCFLVVWFGMNQINLRRLIDLYEYHANSPRELLCSGHRLLDSVTTARKVNDEQSAYFSPFGKEGERQPDAGNADWVCIAQKPCKRESDDKGHECEGNDMLVLSRKKNESIVINDDITIVVVEIRGDKVRLGVEAPKEVPVHRREVFEAIRRNDARKENNADPAETGSGEPG